MRKLRVSFYRIMPFMTSPQQHERVLVFDIDGVLTIPPSIEISDKVIDAIERDLKAGIPAAFNTGRAADWVMERVVPKLEARLTSQELASLLVVAEKGSAVVKFDDGVPEIVIDQTVTVPAEFAKAAKAILDDPLFKAVDWDDGKRTMVTYHHDKKPGTSLTDFRSAKPQLRERVKQLMDQQELYDFKIEETVSSLDVEHVTAGKHKGAAQIMKWLTATGVSAREFICFGDSPNDEAMAEEFASAGYMVKFVYVGGHELKPLPSRANHVRHVMRGRYAEDTVAYLATL